MEAAMFTPTEFLENRQAEIAAITDQFPLAIVIANTAAGLTANHIPLLLNSPLAFSDQTACSGQFIGHVSRRNTMHEEIGQDQEIMVIFRAEDAYISPNWYPTKADHHRHVPTWNYQAIHFHGHMRFCDDAKFLRRVVGKLTTHFESRNQGARAWKMADAPRDFIDRKLAGIVGFEIEVTRCLAKSKLSQNRDRADLVNVGRELGNSGKAFMARSINMLGSVKG
jgi:transcriptional regulator